MCSKRQNIKYKSSISPQLDFVLPCRVLKIINTLTTVLCLFHKVCTNGYLPNLTLIFIKHLQAFHVSRWGSSMNLSIHETNNNLFHVNIIRHDFWRKLKCNHRSCNRTLSICKFYPENFSASTNLSSSSDDHISISSVFPQFKSTSLHDLCSAQNSIQGCRSNLAIYFLKNGLFLNIT